MIHRYFQHRFALSGAHSRFHCSPDCSRPGCASREMQVPVTIFDVVGAALQRNEPVGDVFEKYYVPGVLPLEGLDWITSVSLKLRKPCPFLDPPRCSIYEVRPLPCVLFPEYQAANGTLKILSSQPRYDTYLCLRSPFPLPGERVRTIRGLAGMLHREVAVSDVYLFDRTPFWLDFSPLEEAITHEVRRLHASPAATDAPASEHAAPLEAWDRVFQKTFRQCASFSELNRRMGDLQLEDRRSQVFEDLNDSGRIQKLLQADGDRPRIFRYVDGRLESRRRGLTRREHLFL